MYLLEKGTTQSHLSSQFLNLVYHRSLLQDFHNSEFKQLNEQLDKYYTKEAVAKECYDHLKLVLTKTGVDLSNRLFIEPSAGSGAFLKQVKEECLGFDIAPAAPGVIRNDFLKQSIFDHLTDTHKDRKLIFIGNPPFGKKSNLAIDFINRGLELSDIVAFIVPIQFRKWSAQSKINKDAKLLFDMSLAENSFELVGKDYNLRCCFQVWALGFEGQTDQRIAHKPSTSHPDFEIYQYNRTELAEKYFDFDWDFAVPRQGYQDYNRKEFSKGNCERRLQWIFFKAKNKKTLKRLLGIDFVKLSKKNIGTPGFGKADVVAEYEEKYGNK